jgi:hypothetical protein
MLGGLIGIIYDGGSFGSDYWDTSTSTNTISLGNPSGTVVATGLSATPVSGRASAWVQQNVMERKRIDQRRPALSPRQSAGELKCHKMRQAGLE